MEHVPKSQFDKDTADKVEQSALNDAEAMMDRVQKRVSAEKTEKDGVTKAEEFLDKPGELTQDEAKELARVLRQLDVLAEQKIGNNKEKDYLQDPVIGGSHQIDANELPDSHRARTVSQKGEYV